MERKNGWQLAERASHSTPDAQQWLLNGASWSADALRDLVRAYVVETSAVPGAGRGWLSTMTPRRSRGVDERRCCPPVCGDHRSGRELPGHADADLRDANGHAFVDRRLYLPESWTADRRRCPAAGVLAEVGFATKPALVGQMLTDALDAGVEVDWFTADSGYGRDRALRQVCHDRQVPYVVEVPVNESVATPRGARTAGDFPAMTATRDWQRYSCGHGSKGERYYDWAFHGEVDPGGQTPAPGVHLHPAPALVGQ